MGNITVCYGRDRQHIKDFELIPDFIADPSVVLTKKKYSSPGGGIESFERRRIESNPV